MKLKYDVHNPFRKLYWNNVDGGLERGSIHGDELESVTLTDQPVSRSTTFKRYVLKDGRIIRGVDKDGRMSELIDFEGGIRKGAIWSGPDNTLYFQTTSGTVNIYFLFVKL